MTQRHQAWTGAAFFSWGARRPSRGAGAWRRPRPCLEHLESRRLLSGISEFSVPSGSHTFPDGITAGANGKLWFTEFNADKIGTINSVTDKFAEFPLPTNNAQPFRITLGPDKNIWFTEYGADQIGTINLATDKITEYPLPTQSASPYAITAGPNGTIWFTEWGANQIGMISLATKTVSEFVVPTGDSVPEGITLGPDGNIWFTESLGNKIGMINPTTDKITEFALPTLNVEPDGITAGPGGNLWFTEYAANQIGMLNPTSGAFSQVTIPAAKTEPTEIVTGPDGNIWFTQSATSQIGMLNPATQAISESTPPTVESGPRGIAAGPDGKVWFAELDSGKIGVFAPDTHLVLTIAPPTQLNAGSAFGLTVTVEYDSGAVDTAYHGSVNVALATSPGGGALGGASSAAVVGGAAAFSGLWLSEGGAYTLQINSDGAAASLVGPFSIRSVANSPPNTTPPPTITGETLLFAGKGKHKHLVGFQLAFSAPLDPASAGNSNNYTVTQTMRHGREKIAQAIRLRVNYNASAKTVSLMISGKPRFASGGQLVVNASAPNGITGTAGVYLDGNNQGRPGDNGTFSILPGARGIAR
ncbi:MAG: hypothetical protein ACHRXM_17480 [Isosphaerales bacterium]